MKREILQLLFLLIILFLSSCIDNTITPSECAQNIVGHYNSRSSMEYDIDYQIKFFSDVNDTSTISAKVELIRYETDTILGGYIWIKSDSIESYYNTKHAYEINHTQQSITKFPKDKPYAITGSELGSTIKVNFLKPSTFNNAVLDSTITMTINDDIIENQEAWKLKYEYDDEEYVTNICKNHWINKNNFTIQKMNFSAEMQGENQYNQWDLSNITFDNTTIETLENRLTEFISNYTLEDYEETFDERNELLASGEYAPDLEGSLYRENTDINLSDFEDKLLLIDFWYIDCFPCIKAIPHLNELHHKYSDKGLQVIGINPFDNNEKNLNRLPKFLSNNTIDYPIMFIDKEDLEKYNIYAFPTFYLISENGKVISSIEGFSEDMTSSIDSLIQRNL